jgi:two-component system response regulator CpxR
VHNATTTVLIVDDDRELVSLMQEFLAEHKIVIRTAHNGPEGLRQALTQPPDLVVLDVMMPGFDGFEVLRRLRLESEVPVLMLTAKTEANSRILGLNSGADDYLPKPFEPLELVARIQAILRRTKRPPTNGPVESSGVRVDPGARMATFAGHPLDLTSIEYDILDTLLRSAGRVVSRDDLMQRLYQRPASPFDRSIDVHVSHLRRKLETPSELIRTIRGVGYQFVAEGAEEDKT